MTNEHSQGETNIGPIRAGDARWVIYPDGRLALIIGHGKWFYEIAAGTRDEIRARLQGFIDDMPEDDDLVMTEAEWATDEALRLMGLLGDDD